MINKGLKRGQGACECGMAVANQTRIDFDIFCIVPQ